MSELSEGREIRFKVPLELWDEVKKLAKEDDRTVTEWIRKLLKDVVGPPMEEDE